MHSTNCLCRYHWRSRAKAIYAPNKMQRALGQSAELLGEKWGGGGCANDTTASLSVATARMSDGGESSSHEEFRTEHMQMNDRTTGSIAVVFYSMHARKLCVCESKQRLHNYTFRSDLLASAKWCDSPRDTNTQGVIFQTTKRNGYIVRNVRNLYRAPLPFVRWRIAVSNRAQHIDQGCCATVMTN